jgi:ribosomal protein S18 acetylase RimI-like enzyme
MPDLPITPCTEADFLQIVGSLDQFWDEPRDHLHHRLFLNEFGDSAYVIREGGIVVAYLFGLIGTSHPRAGYVHLIAVRNSHRGLGLGRRLYETFETHARNQGCSQLKAVTSPGNTGSIDFHKSIGMQARVVEHYAGPKEEHHRVVFTKAI